MFTLRFDMRAPHGGAPATDLYAAAIDMCEWAETRGAVLAVLSEHHGADDGHLPVPLTLASAIAARTRTLAILLAAVPIPLWDPVRLAEEISVLDLISRGRVSYAFGVGHRRAAASHRMWRGPISSAPRPPLQTTSEESAYACCRVVDRGSRLERDRCHPAPAGPGTCWRVGALGRQSRQGRGRAGRR
ncbi:LLM class flavin-dependent oxidoreductase [Mycobacterium colombiense]|uniref:LLM class flavin-dependent oxidoreductase n=1 Tax=Mycobacterium colombiense TaxID=339268 RepID=UPI000B1E616C